MTADAMSPDSDLPPPPVPGAPRDPVEREIKRSWFSRNWKWFLPVGCLTAVVVLGGGIALLVFTLMKSSDAYKGAVARAKASPAVAEALGSPVSEGWLTMGSIRITGSSGNANLTIPISGPKGSGTIYVVAVKFADEWTFKRLVVEIDADHRKLDLLEEQAPAAGP